MLIQNAAPTININIGQLPSQAGTSTPGLFNDNRHRPALDQININIGTSGPGQKLAGLLPEIQPGNCRRTCRANAQFGRGGPMNRLMRQFMKLMQQFMGSQGGGGCCPRPQSLAQTPLASINIQPGGQGPAASRCGAPAPQCMPPHQQQAQQIRQLLSMLLNLANNMGGAQQSCPPSSCGSGGAPSAPIRQSGGRRALPSGGGSPQTRGQDLPCRRRLPSRPSAASVRTTQVAIRGGAGDDTIKVTGGGHTRIHGGAGDDRLTHKASADSKTAVIRGGRGDDKIKAKGAKHTRIHGGRGDDKISFKPGENSKTAVIRGGRGDDKIKAKGAKHTRIHGGRGDDKIIFSPTDKSKTARINGGKGNDTLIVKGDSSLNLADKDGNSYFKRGEGGPTVVLNNVEKVRLKGEEGSTTLHLANW